MREVYEQWRERVRELTLEGEEVEREFLALVEELSIYKADPRNERFSEEEKRKAKQTVGSGDRGGGRSDKGGKGCGRSVFKGFWGHSSKQQP